MKRLIRIFPIVILVFLSFFLININDMMQKELYKEIDSYEMLGFRIPENIESINNSDIEDVYEAAIRNDIVLSKSIYNEKRDSIDNYIITDNMIELFSKQFNIEKNEINNNYKSIVTFKTNDRVSYYLNDFLNNDRYAYYSIEEMKNQNIYPYGDYSLYYQNDTNYRKFLKESEEILNVSKDMLCISNWGIMKENVEILLNAMIFCIIFFILFYFILILFILYRDSKKIGVLSLLGFRNKDIMCVMNNKYLRFLFLFSILFIVILMLILPNTTFSFLINLTSMYTVVIIITILISYAGLFCICKLIDLSNMLKKKSIVKIISNICLFAKFIMVAVLVLFSIYMLPFMKEAMNSKELLNENKKLMDYAVFPRIKVENSEYDDYDKYLDFYKEVIAKEIDHIYVNYQDYLSTDQTFIKDSERVEKEGKGYRIASVDINYLNLYKLRIYDEYHHFVDMNTIDQEFYLLPKSKKSYTSSLKEYNEEKYHYYQLDIPVLVYYYDDKIFDTYDSMNGVPKVKSPIFRVIHESNPFTYMEKSYGIDVAGTRMNTGLKFNISKKDNFYQSELYDIIQNVGLQNVLQEDNFVSYKDFYSDEIAKSKKMNTIFVVGISIGLLVYILLVVQTFILFVEARKTEVLVKSILGFSRKDIFSNIILWNLSVTLLPIIGIIAFYVFYKISDLKFVILVASTYILLEFVLLSIVSKIVRINNVYSKLKGE